jgi:diaminopimelate decarboxylase
LILEPGSALVANTMHFVAEVVERKKISSRQVAVVAGSIHNIKPTLHTKKMPVRIFSQNQSSDPEEACEPLDLVGYTCMEHDCLHPRYERNVSVGDYAVFGNVGDYTIVMKPPFIQPSPAIIASRLEGPGFELVKRKEDPSDLFSTYLF